MTRILMIFTNTWKLLHSILWSRQILDTIPFPKYMQLNQLLVLGAVGQQTWLQLLLQKSADFFQVLCSVSPVKMSEILSGAFSCVPCLSLGNWGKPVIVKHFLSCTEDPEEIKTKSSTGEVKLSLHRHSGWSKMLLDTPHLLSFSPHVLSASFIHVDALSTSGCLRWHHWLCDQITLTKV